MNTKNLFLCTGNSCRSQMAEGLAKHKIGQKYSIYSAETHKHGLNQKAGMVMKQIGIDISGHSSKMLEELSENMSCFCSEDEDNSFRVLISPKMTLIYEKEDDKINYYRKVGDKIKKIITNIEQHLP